jgi:hypothetical protein
MTIVRPRPQVRAPDWVAEPQGLGDWRAPYITAIATKPRSLLHARTAAVVDHVVWLESTHAIRRAPGSIACDSSRKISSTTQWQCCTRARPPAPSTAPVRNTAAGAMSWISPQHVEDASRVLQGAAIVLARAAAER